MWQQSTAPMTSKNYTHELFRYLSRLYKLYYVSILSPLHLDYLPGNPARASNSLVTDMASSLVGQRIIRSESATMY